MIYTRHFSQGVILGSLSGINFFKEHQLLFANSRHSFALAPIPFKTKEMRF
jgi:hypothetical protein